MRSLLLALWMACSGVAAAAGGGETAEAGLSIETGEDGGWPAVQLENGVFRAVIRVNPGGGEYGNEHAIRDWILKASGRDIVSSYIDACAQRPPLVRAELIEGSSDRKSVRLFYGVDAESEPVAVSVYTIFAGSRVIRIDYEKYPPWTNTVDITNLGEMPGDGGFGESVTRIHGQEEYLKKHCRGIVFHEESYWNTFDEGYRETDPKDGGPLAYKGHLVMVVGEPESGVGFGRVMPVKSPGGGGAKILKLLWDRGFECFPATGGGAREPFTGWVYAFTGGLDEGVETGRRIVDGEIPKAGGGEGAAGPGEGQ